MSALRGIALLEVLVAMVLLALGAVSLVTLGGEAMRAVARAESTDRDTARASAFLDAVALWPRPDLDRHLGIRHEGPWLMQIERPLPTLYTVTLADTSAETVLLATTLFREEAARALP